MGRLEEKDKKTVKEGKKAIKAESEVSQEVLDELLANSFLLDLLKTQEPEEKGEELETEEVPEEIPVAEEEEEEEDPLFPMKMSLEEEKEETSIAKIKKELEEYMHRDYYLDKQGKKEPISSDQQKTKGENFFSFELKIEDEGSREKIREESKEKKITKNEILFPRGLVEKRKEDMALKSKPKTANPFKKDPPIAESWPIKRKKTIKLARSLEFTRLKTKRKEEKNDNKLLEHAVKKENLLATKEKERDELLLERKTESKSKIGTFKQREKLSSFPENKIEFKTKKENDKLMSLEESPMEPKKKTDKKDDWCLKL